MLALIVAMNSAMTMLPEAEVDVGRAHGNDGQDQECDQRLDVNAGAVLRMGMMGVMAVSMFCMGRHLIR